MAARAAQTHGNVHCVPQTGAVTMSANTSAIEPVAFTIRQFCLRNSISPPTYYKLKAAGLGPKEMRRDGVNVVRISLAAEQEWQRECENPSAVAAEAIGRSAEAVRKRARKAATKAVASPRHVSRQRGRAA
jgi:hypothetical protein